MLCYELVLHSFLSLNDIPLYDWTRSCFVIPQWMYGGVAFALEMNPAAGINVAALNLVDMCFRFSGGCSKGCVHIYTHT